MVSSGVSLSSGTSNCFDHSRTERSAWGAKPLPPTGRAGVFRRVPKRIPWRLNRSTTSFFSASASGLSLSTIRSASTRFCFTSSGLAIWSPPRSTDASFGIRSSRATSTCVPRNSVPTSSVVSRASGSAKR